MAKYLGFYIKRAKVPVLVLKLGAVAMSLVDLASSVLADPVSYQRPEVKQLIEILQLQKKGENTFLGQSADLVGPRVFGGQVLAQALLAALYTTDKLAHSLHAYFLVGGDATLPIEYEVVRLRDGRSFAARQVYAKQKGEVIFTALISCAAEEQGHEFQVDMPVVADAEQLPNEQQLKALIVDKIPDFFKERFMRPRALEFRPINPTNPFKARKEPPQKYHWMRVAETLPDDPRLHQAIIAFTSDFALMSAGMMPHGLSFFDKGFQGASLDHTMHFHHAARADEWMLYDMSATVTAAARGLNYGKIWQNGKLVVSTSQEGLMRLRPLEGGAPTIPKGVGH